jgi:type VII secretion protein EccE
MSQAPAPVRTSTSTYGAPRAGTAELTPRPRHYRLGPLHLLQLLVIEAAILTVLAVLAFAGANPIPIAVAGAAAVGLAILALLRRHNRWLVEWRILRAQYRRRRRSRPLAHTDPRLVALRWLAAGLSVTELRTPDGTPVGVGRDQAGWFAVAATTSTTAMREDAAGGPPIDRLVRLVIEAETPGVTLQVVTHTVPVPSLDINQTSAAGRSYVELAASVGGTPVPRERVTWVVLRLDAMSMAEEVAGDELSPPAVLVSLLRRAVGLLRRAGRRWHILDAEGLTTALARSCDLEPAPNTRGVVPVEAWHSWRSAELGHMTFWVRRWPAARQLPALLDQLATVPAAFSSVAMILVPHGERVDVRCLVRVAAPPAMLDWVGKATVRAAGMADAQLQRLDGEQAPAVYASAPTGGGLG